MKWHCPRCHEATDSHTRACPRCHLRLGTQDINVSGHPNWIRGPFTPEKIQAIVTPELAYIAGAVVGELNERQQATGQSVELKWTPVPYAKKWQYTAPGVLAECTPTDKKGDDTVSSEVTTIYLDLDGTLAAYDGWKGPDNIGQPVPAMVDRLKEWIALNYQVKIFTARFAQHHEHVRAWLERHGLPDLEVTNRKGVDGTQFWDDRAVVVAPNTGEAWDLAAIRNMEARMVDAEAHLKGLTANHADTVAEFEAYKKRRPECLPRANSPIPPVTLRVEQLHKLMDPEAMAKWINDWTTGTMTDDQAARFITHYLRDIIFESEA